MVKGPRRPRRTHRQTDGEHSALKGDPLPVTVGMRQRIPQPLHVVATPPLL
jgi:hypothetical protein